MRKYGEANGEWFQASGAVAWKLELGGASVTKINCNEIHDQDKPLVWVVIDARWRWASSLESSVTLRVDKYDQIPFCSSKPSWPLKVAFKGHQPKACLITPSIYLSMDFGSVSARHISTVLGSTHEHHFWRTSSDPTWSYNIIGNSSKLSFILTVSRSWTLKTKQINLQR